RFGVHVSIAGSIDRAVDRAAALRCDAFQIFTSNPRSWQARELQEAEVAAFREKMASSGLSPAVAHMPYLPNLASQKDQVYQRSVEVLVRELLRCQRLGIPYLVTHPGSHLGQGRGVGIGRIKGALERALAGADCQVMILLETTAGTSNSIGGTFQDLGELAEGFGADQVGVCLDTCHIFVAGYEIDAAGGFGRTMNLLDQAVGLSRLKLVHLNDARHGPGSARDRHEHLGLGQIGDRGLASVLHHPALSDLPVILETPVDGRRDDVKNLEHARLLAR
ncbi:MAG: deoxyribonuclease IV, partial [Methanosarcinales archaeon]|nr:deoxyribonuclease IV [Methanosarcinales archaeon]